MLISAKEIASYLNGEVEGNLDVQVHAPSKIEDGEEGTISFLANPKYEHYAYTTNASILIVSNEFEPTDDISSTLIKVPDVYASIAKLLEKFSDSKSQKFQISSFAFVEKSAELHPEVSVDAFAVIKEHCEIGQRTIIYPHVFIDQSVKIGKDCIIYAGAKIYSNTIIGDNCIIHAGSVIGCDGFGYSKDDQGAYTKIKHVGNVIIENDVEIGANVTIDRATMGSTIIRRGAKIDNLVQIAHNVEIGEDTAMAAQSGIAGSTKVGDRVIIGGQAGIVGHRKIADEVQIQAQSGVISNVKEVGKRLYGYPAIDYHSYLKAYAIMKNLPDLKQQVKELQDQINELKKM